MSTYTYNYNIEGTASAVTAGKSVRFYLQPATRLKINSVVLYGIKSSYLVQDKIEDIKLTCSIGGDYTVGKNYEDASFTVNQTYTPGQSITIVISTSSNAETFELAQGIAQTKILKPDGATGILNTSTTNIPKFAINYEILEAGYCRNDSINEGYPFLDGLITDYGDCIPKSDWYIDEACNINEGYPFLDGLITDYGDYFGGASKIYYNGRQCPIYYNGRQCPIYYNGH